MKIRLQYFDGCHNWKLMEERLAHALVEAHVAGTEVVRERVESPEEAVRLGFRGSPTVLIDGKDPFASGRDSVGLTCRVYRTPNGADGAPSVEELRVALARWAA
ncbi:MAG: thioredoxin family protein [Candidatus Nephthysia bennettiae]|uniref:Thioredoxin family protein n=1 Tax=Candidatus Nephthysia bennettiae TaxID=3127016 RepID=A0A934N2C0_9BACT|nr:thioredoxin family protein [Candidatus Dormibacteraeota bacterium]PZR95827.1 MAG: thioredoxin family protein [Candidatus Dormibacteraeota bacterium]